MRVYTLVSLLLHQGFALPQTAGRFQHDIKIIAPPPQRPEKPVKPNVNPESVLYELPTGFKIEPDLDVNHPTTPGAEMIKIKNGPYTIAPTRMLTISANLTMPCKDCFVTAIMGDLEFENGTTANIENGAWLHHMTMTNYNKSDLVCPEMPQRMYSAGNEREVSRINAGGKKYGLKLGNYDEFWMYSELMNQNLYPIKVYITQIYEFIDEPAATGYKDAQMAWMDITGCGDSHVAALEGAYEAVSPVWQASINGTLLFSTGHTHDGGIDTTLYINGKTICVNGQLYGRKKQYVERNTGRAHISDIGVCKNFGEMKVGDELRIGAHYNSTMHPLEKDMLGVGFEPLMGISRIYVGT